MAMRAPIWMNGTVDPLRMVAPMVVCRFMVTHSASVRVLGFCRIASGTPILPMSCMGAAARIVSTPCRSQPRRRAISAA